MWTVYEQTQDLIATITEHQLVTAQTALLDTTEAGIVLTFLWWSLKLETRGNK